MAPRSPPWTSQYSHLASASYLSDLRNNRPARPNGSRPLPTRPLPVADENVPPRADSALSFHTMNTGYSEEVVVSKEQKLSHRASMPTTNSFGSFSSQKGRPLVPSPFTTLTSQRKVSPPSASLPDVKYKELSSRAKERQEAHSLRQALERIDQVDEERIHNAAKQEAADLVWRHRNPQLAEVEKTAAYRNPDLSRPNYGELDQSKRASMSGAVQSKPTSRSASGESTASVEGKKHRLPWLRKRPKAEAVAPSTATRVPSQEDPIQRTTRKTSGNRKASSGSSKGIFRNPEDEIYEEAEELPIIAETPKRQLPLTSRESNSILRGARPVPEKSHTDPLPRDLRANHIDAGKKTAMQARNTDYSGSRALPHTPVKEREEDGDSPRYIDGYEVRSDDIRAATSMKKSDRSPNLPTPTAVSDRPGRPIVSFDPRWRPGTESPRASQDVERPQARKDDGSMSYPVKPRPSIPEITIVEDSRSPALQKEKQAASTEASPAPPSIVVPAINLPDEDPQPTSNPRPLPIISVHNDDSPSRSIPAINVPCEQPRGGARPMVSMSNRPTRPLPNHTQSAPANVPPARSTRSDMATRVPWLAKTPATVPTSSVTCTACSLPISGRIVTASGSAATSQKARFHPECFTCYHCSTGLECVSFYPEPESARLERCQAAMPHLHPEDGEIRSWVESNQDLHFFCHLDYHELYSPRCHNCKTPIEGAVVLALGRHYHQDHFFCAECGDPFTSESPFVEHNNYPYCVSCHTKRTSARCRACKLPILNEMTIEALGAKWHDACFVCCDCGGDFGEEGRFFVREIEVELTEKEKRKGYGPKIEEKAACQACEERRVKNVFA